MEDMYIVHVETLLTKILWSSNIHGLAWMLQGQEVLVQGQG